MEANARKPKIPNRTMTESQPASDEPMHPMDDDELPDIRCLLGIPIHPAAFVIGIVCLVMSIVIAGYTLAIHSAVLFSVDSCAIAACIFLIIGNHTEIPFLYFPYLVVMPFVILTHIFFAVFSVLIVGVASLGLLGHEGFGAQVAGFYSTLFHPIGLMALVFGVIMLAYALLELYFYYCVLVGYGYLKYLLKESAEHHKSEWSEPTAV